MPIAKGGGELRKGKDRISCSDQIHFLKWVEPAPLTGLTCPDLCRGRVLFGRGFEGFSYLSPRTSLKSSIGQNYSHETYNGQDFLLYKKCPPLPAQNPVTSRMIFFGGSDAAGYGLGGFGNRLFGKVQSASEFTEKTDGPRDCTDEWKDRIVGTGTGGYSIGPLNCGYYHSLIRVSEFVRPGSAIIIHNHGPLSSTLHHHSRNVLGTLEVVECADPGFLCRTADPLHETPRHRLRPRVPRIVLSPA